jgi:hypothetical protein
MGDLLLDRADRVHETRLNPIWGRKCKPSIAVPRISCGNSGGEQLEGIAVPPSTPFAF